MDRKKKNAIIAVISTAGGGGVAALILWLLTKKGKIDWRAMKTKAITKVTSGTSLAQEPEAAVVVGDQVFLTSDMKDALYEVFDGPTRDWEEFVLLTDEYFGGYESIIGKRLMFPGDNPDAWWRITQVDAANRILHMGHASATWIAKMP